MGWAKQNIETTLKFRLSDWVFVFWPFLTIKKSVNNESYTWLQPWYDLSIDLSDMYQVVVNRLMPYFTMKQYTQRPSTQKRSFAKTCMYCIILANHPHGFWKRSAWKHTFLKTGLRVEKPENTALLFSCGQWIHILSKTMTPSPHPWISWLWPLNPATSHSNNNNSGLHACVCAAEDI